MTKTEAMRAITEFSKKGTRTLELPSALQLLATEIRIENEELKVLDKQVGDLREQLTRRVEALEARNEEFQKTMENSLDTKDLHASLAEDNKTLRVQGFPARGTARMQEAYNNDRENFWAIFHEDFPELPDHADINYNYCGEHNAVGLKKDDSLADALMQFIERLADSPSELDAMKADAESMLKH